MPEVWQAALVLLCQQLSKSDADLWIRPISACQTSGGLRLDCPDRYAMAWVQKHFGTAIRDALQQAGATDFFFSFGEPECALQKEREEVVKAQEESRWRELSSMALEEQFAVLVAAYPRKTSGNWFAWRAFRRLAKRQELPHIYDLLQLIKLQRDSEDWVRDAGRWVPGLNNWLRNRPWIVWNKNECISKKDRTRSSPG